MEGLNNTSGCLRHVNAKCEVGIFWACLRRNFNNDPSSNFSPHVWQTLHCVKRMFCIWCDWVQSSMTTTPLIIRNYCVVKVRLFQLVMCLNWDAPPVCSLGIKVFFFSGINQTQTRIDFMNKWHWHLRCGRFEPCTCLPWCPLSLFPTCHENRTFFHRTQ